MKMSAIVHFGDTQYIVDLTQGIDISIPLVFERNGQHYPEEVSQPEAFFLPPATATPFQAGNFIGDTRQGGAANCDIISIAPHGNGTHTECVGHIVDDNITIGHTLQDIFCPAVLLTLPLQTLLDSQNNYDGLCAPEDLVVVAPTIPFNDNPLLSSADSHTFKFGSALILRTLPNNDSKTRAIYSGGNPPYLTREFMHWVNSMGFRHLLVDLPSVDRENDGGKLPNHHLFWGVAGGLAKYTDKTITEMIYIPSEVDDGNYLLNLQIPNFQIDAAPSRPFIFPIMPIVTK